MEIIYLLFSLSIVVHAQNSTITTPPSTSYSPLAELTCWATGAPCLTPSYIFNECYQQYTFIDDWWGCLCSRGYDTEWSKCSSCEAPLTPNYTDLAMTQPYVTDCPSILSVLSRVAATSSSAVSSSTTATQGSSPMQPLVSSTSSSTSTVSATPASAATSNVVDVQPVSWLLRNVWVVLLLYITL